MSAKTQTTLIAVIQVSVMSTWLVVPAISSQLSQQLGVGLKESGYLTVSVQIGFVLGAYLMSIFNLPDKVNARQLIGIASLVASLTTFALLSTATNYLIALILRLLTGVALAGVYPTGVRLMASWSKAGRGKSIGILVAALTLGSALPHFIVNSLSEPTAVAVLTSVSIFAGVGAVLGYVFLQTGPQVSSRPQNSQTGIIGLLKNRRFQFLLLAYVLHMWELYAVWTWLPEILQNIGPRESTLNITSSSMLVLVFVAQGLFGAFGAIIGGIAGDKFGLEKISMWAMIISGLAGLGLTIPVALSEHFVMALALVWGFSIIADSALLSAAVANSVPRTQVGSAVSLQIALGFTATAISIPLTMVIASASTWGLATATLSLGSLGGAAVLIKLIRLERKGNSHGME
jgi:predicted MFS family arabinose efflux permease